MRANGWSRTTAHLNIPTFDTIGFIRCLAPSCSSRWQVGKAAFPCGLAIRIQKIRLFPWIMPHGIFSSLWFFNYVKYN